MQEVLLCNNVKISGKGTHPLLFAHGFGCDQTMWRFVTPAFQDDYQIVKLDYVGSEKSDHTAFDPARYSTLDGYALDVLDVCAALDLKNVTFVGHSVSSMVGVLASIREPERFERLVLIGPSPRYINDLPEYEGEFDHADIIELLGLMDKNYLGWASFLAPVVMKNPDQPELAQELKEQFCSLSPAITRRFAETTFFSDHRADLHRVTVPSLLLQYSDDSLALLSVGDYLQRHLPDSTLQIMKATGHCPHLTHPGETIHLMREYFDRDATTKVESGSPR